MANARHDLVVRNGTVADGSGHALFEADIAVQGDRIVEIGAVRDSGREEIDARGRLVTPGFVDIHTHYDAQVTWEEWLRPSTWHGVTTAVGGNCGVGFAPCRPADREKLVRLMEGIEDIPEIVMAEGLPWTWESFPDFLSFVGARAFDCDVGFFIPHSPIRVYVMGQRGIDREPATVSDREWMRAIVAEGIRAGALGVSTSRFLLHRTRAGEPAPSLEADEAELQALANGLRDAGSGIFQMIPDMFQSPDHEFAVIQRVAETGGRPVTFSLAAQSDQPEGWRRWLQLLEERAAGATIVAQVCPRPIGVMFGLDLSVHPFSLNPSYRRLEHRPLAEKVAAMRDPAIRARLLAETPEDPNPFLLRLASTERNFFLLGAEPDYGPPSSQEAQAIADRRGISRKEVVYDMLLEDEGRAILYSPSSNFIDNKLTAAGQLVRHPDTMVGLGDGGAHYGMICDSSITTYLLAHWARDANSDERIGVPEAVRMLTAQPASLLGLEDRGRIAVGRRADLNVIDFDRLALEPPHVQRDLPAGGRRLMQRARGYDATVLRGAVTYRDGQSTGVRPGRLVGSGART